MLRRKLLVLVAGICLLFPACGSGASLAYRNHLPTDAAAPVPPDLAIRGAAFVVHAPGRVNRKAVQEAWAGVLAALNGYLEAGVLTPLRSGGPAGDLGPYFTVAAAERVSATPSDRAAFVDEGLPPATAITKETGVATLSALVDDQGAVVVAAQLELRLNAQIEGGPVTVSRTGELVFMPEGGAWKIDAYDIRASRDSVPA